MRRLILIIKVLLSHSTIAKALFFLIAFFLFLSPAKSQAKLDSLFNKLDPQKWSAIIEKKVSKLEEQIIAKSEKMLRKLQREEEKIYRKLISSKDSLLAKAKLEEIKNRYTALQEKLKNPSPIVSAANLKEYIPYLDTLSTAFNFLDKNGVTGKVGEALSKIQSLQGRLQQANEIKDFIKERKRQLKEYLQNLGLVRQLKKINKEIFYYGEQLRYYRDILSDSKKIEREAIRLLSGMKFFRDFMKKNSLLASLFPMPGGSLSGQSAQTGFAAIQTRTQVTSFIQQTGMVTAATMPQLQQNIQGAQSQLSQLRNKISQLFGGSGEDLEMPDFKYNSQKVKPFFKRIEVSADLQTQKANGVFPTISDLAVSAGYRINDKSIAGIGFSHKLGWGTGWNNIRFTHSGVALRSFIDVKLKLKGELWISGGYEMNYRSEIKNIDQLKDQSAWQKSGLLGVTKSLELKTKVFKKTKLQLLWDFLSYRQRPRAPALLFRIGYSF